MAFVCRPEQLAERGIGGEVRQAAPDVASFGVDQHSHGAVTDDREVERLLVGGHGVCCGNLGQPSTYRLRVGDSVLRDAIGSGSDQHRQPAVPMGSRKCELVGPVVTDDDGTPVGKWLLRHQLVEGEPLVERGWAQFLHQDAGLNLECAA